MPLAAARRTVRTLTRNSLARLDEVWYLRLSSKSLLFLGTIASLYETIVFSMHKNYHQFKPPKRKRYVTSGVTLPIYPYYYLWYGSGFAAPYGGPGGSNETAQNEFGKDSTSGAGTGEGAGGDGGGSGSV